MNFDLPRRGVSANPVKKGKGKGIMKRLFCKFMCIAVVMTSMLGFTACGNGNGEKEAEQISKPVKLYFVNEDYLETGDAARGVLIEYDGITINLPKETPEGMTEEQAASMGYTAAISQLWDEPDVLEDAETLVTRRTQFNDIVCKDGTAYVDIKGDSLQGGGSLEETLFISQIVETLVNSFDEIERVQFLIDGQQVDTLMGHCDVSVPLEKGYF